MIFSLTEQMACVRREIAMRRGVYIKRIEKGYMTKFEADREIHLMEAVLDTLEKLLQEERNKKHEL